MITQTATPETPLAELESRTIAKIIRDLRQKANSEMRASTDSEGGYWPAHYALTATAYSKAAELLETQFPDAARLTWWSTHR